jgi:predicted O-methyltransferase YrrM|tara:strand:+ start:399 stop:893 length:495 start_codon:yes stop_codon:yes gene_type:complete
MSKRKDLLDIPMTIEWSGKSNRRHFLCNLIQKNNFTSMAEVGVRDGRTTFHLLDQNSNLTIYAIDNNINQFYNNEVKEKYRERLIAIEGNSPLLANLIPQVDLIFIDADHSYQGCSRDILAYKNKIKNNGLLTGHDIDYPGVNKAVKELIGSYDVGPNNVWIAK